MFVITNDSRNIKAIEYKQISEDELLNYLETDLTKSVLTDFINKYNITVIDENVFKIENYFNNITFFKVRVESAIYPRLKSYLLNENIFLKYILLLNDNGYNSTGENRLHFEVGFYLESHIKKEFLPDMMRKLKIDKLLKDL